MRGSMIRLLVLTLLVASCNESFNAGATKHDGLPVDGRNPVILLNDSAGENWFGEYAMLLANSGGPEIVDIIVTTGGLNTDLVANVRAWRNMVKAAREGGLSNIPDPTESISDKLPTPASGNIMDTDISANRTPGATLIVNESKRLSQPYRPLVVVAASRLTDVAAAYLMDRGVADRVVVVASVGDLTSSGADMGIPNGEMDPWADFIIATKMTYIQVIARYNSHREISNDQVKDLPKNAFGDWIAKKQPNIWDDTRASDQVAIAAVGIPGFVTKTVSVSPDTTAGASSSAGPPLKLVTNGYGLLISEISPDAAVKRFWQMLQDPSTFVPNPDGGAGTK